MTLPIDSVIIDGAKLDARVATNLKPESEILRSMEGAPTVTLVIHDPERELLETGILTRAHAKTRKSLKGTPWDFRVGRARLIYDNRFYIFAGLDKQGSDLRLSFEGRISSKLRHQFKPVSAQRKDYTRAQFIKYRLIKPTVPDALVWSPSLPKKQKVDEPEPEHTKRGIRVHTGLTIKGVPIDRDQAKVITTALRVADEEKAPVRARMALVVGMIQESLARNLTGGDRDSVGVLQLRVSYHGLENASSVEKSVRLFLTRGFWGKGGAIELARKNPGMPVGTIAQNVQGSGYPSAYEPHIPEAEKILEAYGSGVFDDGGATTEKTKRFRFKAGGKRGTPEEENYLEAIERLVEDEVGWRFFEDDNICFVASDVDFLRRMPIAMVAEDPTARQRKVGVQMVGNIDFPYHVADENSHATFQASADEWFGFPGAVIQVVDLGPLTGKNLMWEFRQSVLSPLADITLHRPTPPQKEPAPEKKQVSTADVGAVPTSRGNLTYPLSNHGALIGTPGAGTHNGAPPFNNWQSSNAVDIGVPDGTTVFAVADGTVVKVAGSYSGGSARTDGFQITLAISNNTWWYTHLSTCRVQAGDKVEAGQVLGKSGSANGVPHLHIACERGNPQTQLGL